LIVVSGHGSGGCSEWRGRNAKIQRRPAQSGSNENSIGIRPPKPIPLAAAIPLPVGESHDRPTMIMTGSGSNELIVRVRTPRMRRRAKSTLPTTAPMAITAATDDRATYHSVNRGGRFSRGGEPKTLEAAEAIYHRQNKAHMRPRELTILHRYFSVVFMAWILRVGVGR
jgi:alpha-beta hydrolase superfamily lysophospholipase